MEKRRCSLCGGKLVNNRCVECGLDNSQSDEQYKNRVNKSSCDSRPLTHVHEERQRHADRIILQNSSRTEKTPVKRKQNQSFGSKSVFILGYIIFIIAVIIMVVWNAL